MGYLQPELKCTTSSFYSYFKGPLSNKCSEGSMGKELSPHCAATAHRERNPQEAAGLESAHPSPHTKD